MHESLQDVIYKANITDSGTVSIEKVDDGSVGELSFGSRSIYRYEFDDSTIFIAYLAVYKMDSSNNIPTKISLPIVGGIILSTSSDNYYFIYGEDESSDYVLLKVNPKDDTYTSTDTSGFDLYSLSTNQNDELVFYGLRHADSKKVFAQIEIDGSISVIEEISNNEIIVLERIR